MINDLPLTQFPQYNQPHAMKNSIAIITPTGDRPEMLAILKGCVERQSIRPSSWVVVDDGAVPSSRIVSDLPYVKYVRRERTEKGHTLKWQMLEALRHVETDVVVIMEDDDWYGADYLKNTLDAMADAELFGWKDRVYYHLQSATCRKLATSGWAIWALTAFRKSVYKKIMDILPSVKGHNVDVYIWKYTDAVKRTARQLIKHKRDWFYLGIKGCFVGRPGLTKAHRHLSFRIDDAENRILNRIIGNDKDKYYALLNLADTLTSSDITVATISSGNPLHLAILRNCIEQQTVKPSCWMILDCGPEPVQHVVADLPYVAYVRCEHSASAYSHKTQMLEFLNQVESDIVIMMNERTWYGPAYLDETVAAMGDAELFGWSSYINYAWTNRTYAILDSNSYALLALTAFRKSLREHLLLLHDNAVDFNIWARIKARKKLMPQKSNRGHDWLAMTFAPLDKQESSNSKISNDIDGEFLLRILGNDKPKYDMLMENEPSDF